MTEAGPQRGPVTRQDAVEDVEASDRRRRDEGDVDPPQRRRCPGKQGVEEVDQYQPEPEVWQCPSEQSIIVGELADDRSFEVRSRHAQRYPNQKRQEKRQRDELQGSGKAQQQVFDDGLRRLP
jgi:hypothetical protein